MDLWDYSTQTVFILLYKNDLSHPFLFLSHLVRPLCFIVVWVYCQCDSNSDGGRGNNDNHPNCLECHRVKNSGIHFLSEEHLHANISDLGIWAVLEWINITRNLLGGKNGKPASILVTAFQNNEEWQREETP